MSETIQTCNRPAIVSAKPLSVYIPPAINQILIKMGEKNG